MSIAILILLFAVVIGTTGMVGMFAYFFHRMSRLESGRGTDGGSDHLIQRVEAMEEELLATHSEIVALVERLDFTEKLLTPSESESGTRD